MTTFRSILDEFNIGTRIPLPFWVECYSSEFADSLEFKFNSLNVNFIRFLNSFQFNSFGDSKDELLDLIAGNDLDIDTEINNDNDFPEFIPTMISYLHNSKVIEELRVEVSTEYSPQYTNMNDIFHLVADAFHVGTFYFSSEVKAFVVLNASPAAICSFLHPYGILVLSCRSL